MTRWNQSKHSRQSDLETTLLNSMEVNSCPFRQSAAIVKDGRQKNGTRRYRWKSCGKRFSPLTGTLLDSHKIPFAEWIEFCIHLFQFQSLNVSAIDNRNVYSTGRYWLKKIFLCLEDYQEKMMLKGKAYIDETYVSVMPKDLKRKDGKSREACPATSSALSPRLTGHILFLRT